MLSYLLYYVNTHHSVDVSINVRLAAAGFVDILSGIAPNHPMFREGYNASGVNSDDEGDDTMEKSTLLGSMDVEVI